MKTKMFAGILFAGFILLAAGCSEGLLGSLDKLHEQALEQSGGGGKTYTVTFDKNGGEGEAPAAQTKLAGSSITLPPGTELKRNDDTFGGWNTLDDGSGDNYLAGSSYTVNGDVTLYARWVSPTYTITYDKNGANTDTTPPAPKTVNAGASYNLPDQGGLLKTGYHFDGWNTQSDGKGQNIAAGTSYTPTASRTLYARWICTVTFLPGTGGTGTAPAPITNITAGSSIDLPGKGGLSNAGNEFAGWSTQISGNTVNTPYTPNGDTNLYAQWATVFTVTFSLNGGTTSGTAPGSQTVAPNTYIDLPVMTGFSKTNYTLSNVWNTLDTGKGENINAGSSYKVTGNITLYVRWDSTVTFNGNSNTSGTAPGSQTVAPGVPVTIPGPNTLLRTSFAFYGWNTLAAGTGIDYKEGSTITPTMDITLYAKWGYTVDFNANGGTPAPAQQIVVSGGKVTQPAGITRTGFTFGGWYKDSSFTTLWNFATDTVTANTTLYAKWGYTVDFNANSGTPAPAQQIVVSGGKVTQPAGMTRTGFTFDGWYKDSSFTTLWDFTNDTVSADLTLFAKWIFPVPGTTIQEKFDWLKFNASSNTYYLVTVAANNTLNRVDLNYTGLTNINITIKSADSGTYTVTQNDTYYYMFDIYSGFTLVLDSGVTLIGHQPSTSYPTVRVYSGATFIMNNNSRITGCKSTNAAGSAVYVSKGTFIMNGGSIDGNTGIRGVGVLVQDPGGNFTMNGGSITNNSSTSASSEGGGVFVGFNGTFTMNNGTISNNNTNNGAGVCVYSNGLFTMNDGTISNNTATNFGGGVQVVFTSRIIKTGGSIYGADGGSYKNSSATNGGQAVYVDVDGTGTSVKRRTYTAGAAVNLDSNIVGTPGGWDS